MSAATFFGIFSCALGGISIVLVFLLIRATRRLLQFDDLMGMLAHDVETNLKYFAKLLGTPVYSNSPEIIEAHHNMGIIGMRLNEYVNKMEEMAGKELRTKPEKPNPPVLG